MTGPLSVSGIEGITQLWSVLPIFGDARPTGMDRLMRHLLIACLALLLAASPVAAYAQSEPPPAVGVPAPVEEPKPFDYYPLVVGAGAIAGVVGFNLLALGLGALPGGMAYAAPAGAAVMVPAEMSVAMSRVYATTSAVAGGLLAYYLYAP